MKILDWLLGVDSQVLPHWTPQRMAKYEAETHRYLGYGAHHYTWSRELQQRQQAEGAAAAAERAEFWQAVEAKRTPRALRFPRKVG